MEKIDILVYFSDQHSGMNSGFMGDLVVRTPNLDQLAKEGTVFEQTYTPCPLCIPARTGFLTGQYPSRVGVFDNDATFSSDQATFVHALAANGYETTLCGRMHFLGKDQRHGFSRRLVGDICHPDWGHGADQRTDYGDFGRPMMAKYCLEIIGKGDSQVLAYDADVVKSATQYLSENHPDPQFMVVGTFAPHFPYVGPPELYDYYLDKVSLPNANQENTNYSQSFLDHKRIKTSDKSLLQVKAAYFAMIENMDREIGIIREQWEDYLARNNRKGIFIYLSDHGDQIGERDLYGKQTFFESSAKIPLIMQGYNIPKGKRVTQLASLLDIGPTLCELTKSTPVPDQDGMSLLPLLSESNAIEFENRFVMSEFLEKKATGEKLPARMVRKGAWKYITYNGFEDGDLLFNIDSDPFELDNLAKKNAETTSLMRSIAYDNWDCDAQVELSLIKDEHHKILNTLGRISKESYPDAWTWDVSAEKKIIKGS